MSDEKWSAQTVKMPVSTLKRLKHYCTDKELSQQDAMLAAIEEYLNRRAATQRETTAQ
jgi:hypothetical protein